MLTIVFIGFGVCYAVAVGIGVLYTNPRRPANQAFANLALLCAVWCSCVMMSLLADYAHHDAAAIDWLTANTVLAAFLPWANWLVKESLASDCPTKQLLRRSWRWFVLGLVLVALSFTPSFVIPPVAPGGIHQHGGPYFIYILLEVAGHLLIVLEAYRQTRRQVGIRRLEIQYVIVNLGVAYFICGVLNGVGSLLHLNWIKLLTFPIGFAAFGITGWAITVHRVFDARQVLLTIAHNVTVVVFAGLLVLGLSLAVKDVLPFPFELLSSGIVATVLALWLDKALRRWAGLDGKRDLQRIRTAVIDISKTKVDTEELIAAFEELLRRECHTEFAGLALPAFNRTASFPLNREHAAFGTICELGWATPESLYRRRASPGLAILAQFLAEHSLALLLVAPRGSPTPSLFLGLGQKTNRGPFTFPEVERLLIVAELMDNILARARLTTQAALQAKTEHLAMMSRGLAHDLKNLITPISSFLVHTDRKFPPASDEAEVHGAAKRSVRIITDYISEALFFANRLTPRYERVEVRALLDAVRDVTARRATEHRVQVSFSSEPVPLVADAVLLQRMLGNLVNNAIDASPAGSSVEVTVTPAPHDGLRIVVADHGCGIPEANLKRVFDPYFTTKQFGDDVRGFGLGLTICQKIVALHQGSIALQSQVGSGTTFTIELPQSPPPASANGPATRDAPSPTIGLVSTASPSAE